MFLTDLILQPSLNRLWKLTKPLIYRDELYGDITVFSGAITDGASIPSLLWPLVGSPLRDPRVAKAAALHDQLYKALGVGLTRKQCDEVFYRALCDEGVSRVKAGIYYLGVRLGGWLGWGWYAADREEALWQSTLISIEE